MRWKAVCLIRTGVWCHIRLISQRDRGGCLSMPICIYRIICTFSVSKWISKDFLPKMDCIDTVEIFYSVYFSVLKCISKDFLLWMEYVNTMEIFYFISSINLIFKMQNEIYLRIFGTVNNERLARSNFRWTWTRPLQMGNCKAKFTITRTQRMTNKGLFITK